MEGPSLVILKEELLQFKGKKITRVGGNSKIGKERLLNQSIVDFKTWGKHLLVCFPEFTLRIHFLMFGSYRINETKDSPPRLALHFKKGEINFYNCSVRIIEGDLDAVYDWSVDVMSDKWNEQSAIRAVKKYKDEIIADVLLDQNIFAGVGNIIKNEVLFRVKVHPETRVKALPSIKVKEIVREARKYSFDFYDWKKKYELRKHWQVYRQKNCPDCGTKITLKKTGKRERRSFFCAHCQVKYGRSRSPKTLVNEHSAIC